MTRRLHAILLTLSCAAICAPATAQHPSTEIEAGSSRDHLSGGRAAWHSYELELTRNIAARQTLYATTRENERFNLRDSQFGVGYYHPLSAGLTGQIEAQYSPEHRVLAHRSLFGQLAWAAGDGWVFSGGLRRSNYSNSDTTITSLGAERYFSDFRAAYTLYLGRPDGAATGSAHRVSLNRYYHNERSYIGVSASAGREVENVGPPLGITSTRVRELGLVGRHWLTPAWALGWELSAREQGSLYDRRGLRIALRHRF